MGINGLLPLLTKGTSMAHLKDFAGETIAVDAHGWLHNCCNGCAVELATNVATISWIKIFFAMVMQLKSHDIKIWLVFDGADLPSKAVTDRKRALARESSRQLGLQLFRSGPNGFEGAKKYLQKAITITPLMVAKVIAIAKRFHPDILCTVAPYEADAQLAFLALTKQVSAVISEDSDLLAYGCPVLLTKLDHGKCKRVDLENFFLSQSSISTASKVPARPPCVVDFAAFSMQMFILTCVVTGCDYLVSYSLVLLLQYC